VAAIKCMQDTHILMHCINGFLVWFWLWQYFRKGAYLTYKSNLPYGPQLILVWLSHLNQLSPYLLSNIN